MARWGLSTRSHRGRWNWVHRYTDDVGESLDDDIGRRAKDGSIDGTPRRKEGR